MQNAAMQAADVDAVYVALPCDATQLEPLMRTLARAGGGGNVTIPHKQSAAAAVDRPTADVQATGACNCFWLEHGRLCGDNTDVTGFRTAAEALLGPLHDARALVLGAGGAARAVVHALLQAGARRVELLGRNAGSVLRLIEQLGRDDPALRPLDGLTLRQAEFDVVINATPLGMQPSDPLPFDLDHGRRIGAVIDLVYRAGGTPWLACARQRGIPAQGGEPMLVAQGEAAFARWFGRASPAGVMAQAIAAAEEKATAQT